MRPAGRDEQDLPWIQDCIQRRDVLRAWRASREKFVDIDAAEEAVIVVEQSPLSCRYQPELLAAAYLRHDQVARVVMQRGDRPGRPEPEKRLPGRCGRIEVTGRETKIA